MTNEQIREMLSKMDALEHNVQRLEGQLTRSNQEITQLKAQKQELEEVVRQMSVGTEFVDAVRKESVEEMLQRKEKSFHRFVNANQKQKPPGHLKLELLSSILQEYPNLVRPVIHIKLTQSDFQ